MALKNVLRETIVDGPNLRDLDLLLTDPFPCGSYRAHWFQLSTKSRIRPEINLDITGMERKEKDPKGGRNDFIWHIKGSAGHIKPPKSKAIVPATFIGTYSPITRTGEITFAFSYESE